MENIGHLDWQFIVAIEKAEFTLSTELYALIDRAQSVAARTRAQADNAGAKILYTVSLCCTRAGVQGIDVIFQSKDVLPDGTRKIGRFSIDTGGGHEFVSYHSAGGVLDFSPSDTEMTENFAPVLEAVAAWQCLAAQ